MFLVEQKKSCFKSLIKVGSKLIKYQLHNCNVVLINVWQDEDKWKERSLIFISIQMKFLWLMIINKMKDMTFIDTYKKNTKT